MGGLNAAAAAVWLAMARKIWLTVKLLAKKETVTQQSNNEYRVAVHAPAEDGRANARLIELLAEHFHTAKANIHILHGHGSRKKLIEID